RDEFRRRFAGSSRLAALRMPPIFICHGLYLYDLLADDSNQPEPASTADVDVPFYPPRSQARAIDFVARQTDSLRTNEVRFTSRPTESRRPLATRARRG